uniref:Uncharacterized protein n=1 Tax=Anguilla anguilla TaxID=7936 RepID=A0A0E9XW67_ANGAN
MVKSSEDGCLLQSDVNDLKLLTTYFSVS